jgi:hypothetical protein
VFKIIPIKPPVLALAVFCIFGTATPSRAAMFNFDLTPEEKADKNEAKRQEFAAAWLKKWAYLGPLYEKERRYRLLVDIAKDKLTEARENEARSWLDVLLRKEESDDVKAAGRVLADYQRELTTVRQQIEEYYQGGGGAALSP